MLIPSRLQVQVLSGVQKNTLRSSNWLGHSPFTGKLTGSSPVRSTKNKTMKKLLIILLMLLSSTAFAQKPMVGFTVTEIKERNRLEFGTTNWKRLNQSDYWVIYTVDPNFDLMTMYFFKWGGTENIMCAQSTKSDDIAREMLTRIIETHHNLGDNHYKNNNGIVVHYKWQSNIETHQFMYFNPEGKRIF